MTPRTRSQDLTADLMHDLTDGVADYRPAASAAARPVSAASAARGRAPAPSAFVETSLFLPPRNWLRPRVSRAGAMVSLDIGPLRLRFGGG
jgi:hypothetical protein